MKVQKKIKPSYFRRKCQEWNVVPQNELGIPWTTIVRLYEGDSCPTPRKRPHGKRATTGLHHLVQTHKHSQKTWLSILLRRTVSPVCIPEANISDLPKPTAEKQVKIMVKEPGLSTYLPLPSCVSAPLWVSVFPIWKMGKIVIPISWGCC